MDYLLKINIFRYNSVLKVGDKVSKGLSVPTVMFT